MGAFFIHTSFHVLGNPCMPSDVVMYEVRCKEVTTVHCLLDRHEWKGRPEAHPAIDSEKNGLLEGGTWWKVVHGWSLKLKSFPKLMS